MQVELVGTPASFITFLGQTSPFVALAGAKMRSKTGEEALVG
jgi:hypothetical protein